MFLNPNVFAYFALLAFVPVCLVVGSVLRPNLAVTVLVLAGTLLLPQRLAFDFPGLPSFHKESITYLAVLVAMLIHHPGLLLRARPGRGPEWLVGVMALGGFATALTNRDTLFYGPTVKPGLDAWGGLSTIFEDVVRFGIPFLLGRTFVRSARDLRLVLLCTVVAGLILTPLILLEVRLSPQLHRWVYGYLPDNFGAAVRWGGYRPFVFMESGIALGIFMATTTLAATTLSRIRAVVLGVPATAIKYYLLAFVLLVKSLAAAIWALVFLPTLSMLSARWLARVAAVGAAFVALYPALRLADVFPRETLVATASAFDETRAGSLNFRFDMEEQMLGRWRERPWFGWGGYSRNWTFDPVTGKSQTVPDGAWIIQVSSRGVVGLATFFGIYLVPIWYGWRHLSRIPRPADRLLVAGSLCILLVRTMDQLPNGFYGSFPIFLAGGVYGTVQRLKARPRRARPHRRPEPPRPEEARASLPG